MATVYAGALVTRALKAEGVTHVFGLLGHELLSIYDACLDEGITVIGTRKTTAVIALFVPIIVVALPVLDVAFSIFRRFQQKKPIMAPDREHFHHRLLNLGWTQREIVLLMYLITMFLAVTAILLTVFKGMTP